MRRTLKTLMNQAWLRFLAASTLSFVLVALFSTFIGNDLHVTTDLIGFPVHENFNINRVFYHYYLTAFLFPILTLILFQFLSRNQKRTGNTFSLRPYATGSFSGTSRLTTEEKWILAACALVVGFLHIKLDIPPQWDLFHEGEKLVTGDLLEKGAFPFRDFIFVHGLWAHPVSTWISFKLFGQTRDGFFLGVQTLWWPLFFVGQFLLFSYFFGRHKFFVFILTALPFALPQVFNHPDLRFIFYPILLWILSRAIEKKSIQTFALLGFLSAIHFVFIPEAVFWLFAFCAVALGIDLTTSVKKFSFTKAFVGGGSFVALLWSAILVKNNAFSAHIEYFTNFGVGHRYGSGIIGDTVLHAGWTHIFALIAPVLCMIALVWHFFFKFKNRETVTTREWLLFAIGIFTVFFYQKALSRLDHHVFQPFTPALPLLYTVFFNVFSSCDKALRQRWAWLPRPATLGSIVVAGFAIHIFSSETRASAAAEFQLPRVSDTRIQKILNDFDILFDEILEPQETVYDFTNHSMIFSFFLQRPPVSRYHYVNYAMHIGPQRTIIQDLKEKRPKIAVINHHEWSDNMDGIENMVRHYEVSHYLLQNYKPYMELNGYTLFQRNDLNLPTKMPTPFQGETVEENLYFRASACDWGYAPHFLSEQWVKDSQTKLPKQPEVHRTSGTTWNIDSNPEDFKKAKYLQIELVTPVESAYSIRRNSLSEGGSNYQIIFKSRSSSQTVIRVPVGSCHQWYGFDSTSLKLVTSQELTIKNILLYP